MPVRIRSFAPNVKNYMHYRKEKKRAIMTDKELIEIIQKSAKTIYNNAEKMAGNYSGQTGLDIGIRVRFNEIVEITVNQTLIPENLYKTIER